MTSTNVPSSIPCMSISNIHANIDAKTIQKMVFICNAIEDRWQVSKKQDTYVFTKKHEGRREVFSENYLSEFIAKNISPNTLN
jgi:hypothetical protein